MPVIQRIPPDNTFRKASWRTLSCLGVCGNPLDPKGTDMGSLLSNNDHLATQNGKIDVCIISYFLAIFVQHPSMIQQPSQQSPSATRSLRIWLVVRIWMALRDPLMGHEHGLSKASIIAVHVSLCWQQNVLFFASDTIYLYTYNCIYIYIHTYHWCSLIMIMLLLQSVRTALSLALCLDETLPGSHHRSIPAPQWW